MREKLERHRRRRLLIEAKKLNPREERALAEEGMTGEEAAPPREDLVRSLLQVLERQPGALSQAEADRIATEAKHRTRKRRRK